MQGICHTNGSQTRMEPHKVLSLVSSDVNVLVIYGNEGSYEEISKGISTVPGRDSKFLKYLFECNHIRNTRTSKRTSPKILFARTKIQKFSLSYKGKL